MKTPTVNIGQDTRTTKYLNEPYLLQKGLLARTNRGRCVTKEAYRHLGIKYFDKNGQIGLFD